ncbi:Hsp70 protein [Leishmania braziliensis]|nr:Hsp70 protein [Leishmania braziliensis]
MPFSSSSSLPSGQRCGHRRPAHRTQPFPLLRLLSLVLLALSALSRRRTSALFALATGDAGAAPPLLAITETELISIDLGHESMKVSAWRVQQQHAPPSVVVEGDVAAAVPTSTGTVSVVLNDQANRKSPPCVAFRYFRTPSAAPTTTSGGVHHDTSPDVLDSEEESHTHRRCTALHPRGYQLERTFAEQALALAPRFPTQVVCSAAQLLGYTAALPNATTAESRMHALTSGQLMMNYSFHVVPLTALNVTGTATANGVDETQQQQQQQQQQQERNSVVGRQALGVYVPFFTTSNAPGQLWQRMASDRSTVSAAESKGALFSSEELTAMLLGYARRMAEKADTADNALSEEDQRLVENMRKDAGNSIGNADAAAGETGTVSAPTNAIRYAALTVPVHATVAQRQALVDAAALAGLRVVRLVHSTTGAAVQLAYAKAEQVLKSDKVQYVMIYDMGSQQAEVAIYSFTALPAAVASRANLQGALEMQAIVGSRTLGGAAFDECIASHWDARYFNRRVLSGVLTAAGGGEAERREAAKERGSLLRAAQRAKEMLSANNEAHVTIDGVHADPSHFDPMGQQELLQRRVTVTADGGLLSLRLMRRDFEEWCRPLFDAAVALRDEAIAATGGVVKNLGALSRFEVIGGGTRVPRLLQQLGEGYRSGIVDRTLNSDEAAVMGTTLLALSTAPPELRMRGSQALPRYNVREWLTSAVYASVELRSARTLATAAAAAPPEVQLLFPALKVVLPATRSLRVRVPDVEASPADSVIITLYSGAEADSAYADSTRSSAFATANCASCYVRTCTVEGMHKAAEQLLAQFTQQNMWHSSANPHPTHARMVGAEVVVEVVATVSGIPHCSVAYLRAEIEEVGAGPNIADDVQGNDAAVETATEVSLGNSHHDDSASGASQATQEDKLGEGEGEGGVDKVNASEIEVTRTDARMNADSPADPATNGTSASSTSPPHESQPPPQVQVRVTPLSLRVSSGATAAGAAEHRLSYNMDSAELDFSHRRVRQLQALDDVRLRRSTLRNEMESMLVWIKEHNPTWNTEDAQASDEPSPPAEGAGHALPQRSALQTWRAAVRQVSEWLDDFGDTASATALEERLRIIAGVKAALREAARHE